MPKFAVPRAMPDGRFETLHRSLDVLTERPVTYLRIILWKGIRMAGGRTVERELELGDVVQLAGTAASTETRIKTAAVFLFANKGYSATGMREIAGAAGITNAGIYHFFINKESLLLDIMRDVQFTLDASAEANLASAADPTDSLCLLVSGLVIAHGLNRMVTRVNDGELRALTSDTTGYNEIVGLRDEYESRWSEALRDGVDSEQFTISDVRLTRLSLMAMCTGMSGWYRPGGPTGLLEIARHFAGTALQVVSARRGHGRVTVDEVRLVPLSQVARIAWEPRFLGDSK